MGAVAKKVGESLRRHRKDCHLTQAAVGKAVGVSGNQIGRYEAGKAFPREAVLERAAELFGCDPVDFFDSARDLIDKAPSIDDLKRQMADVGDDLLGEYLKIIKAQSDHIGHLAAQLDDCKNEVRRLNSQIVALRAKN